MTVSAAPATWKTGNKIGIGLAIAYGIVNIPSVLFSAPEGSTGPPMAIMIVCTVCGVVSAIGGVIAWRSGSRSTVRLVAACAIVITLTSLPAFFVDVPASVKVLVAAGVVLTVVMVVLMLTPPNRVGETRIEGLR